MARQQTLGGSQKEYYEVLRLFTNTGSKLEMKQPVIFVYYHLIQRTNLYQYQVIITIKEGKEKRYSYCGN